MRQNNHIFKLAIIVVLSFSALLIPAAHSLASDSSIIGFIIEAKKMEGVLQNTKVITGDTSIERDRPMLELQFDQLSIQGLQIKKLVRTANGIITFDMNSKETVFLNGLSLKITNAEFGESFNPATGNIGLTEVHLLTHSISTANSTLPQLSLDFKEGGLVEMEPKSEKELFDLKTVLDGLVK